MIREFRERGFGGGRDRGRSGGFGGGRGGFGGGRGGFNRDRDSGASATFDTTCSTCGKSCQVPFKPTGSKPVLCSDCFGKSDSGNRFSGAQSSGNSKQLDQINAKLDKIIAILGELELDVDEEEMDEQSDTGFVEDDSEKVDVTPAEESGEDFGEDSSDNITISPTEDVEEEF